MITVVWRRLRATAEAQQDEAIAARDRMLDELSAEQELSTEKVPDVT